MHPTTDLSLERLASLPVLVRRQDGLVPDRLAPATQPRRAGVTSLGAHLLLTSSQQPAAPLHPVS